ANFTRQARRAFKTTDEIDIISLLGDDEEAETALKAVNVSGINCHINKTHGQTPVQYIKIQQDGEKDFFKYDRGVLENFYIDDDQKQILKNADLIMTPIYWQIKNVFDIVLSAETKAKIAVDFSDFATDPDFDLLEKYLGKIDIAFFGLSINHCELIDRLCDLSKSKNKLMIITLGEKGSMSFSGNEKFQCPAMSVANIVDTTGAGDAFAAGFLSSFVHQENIEKALKEGSKIAAITIQHLGSVPT
ncbi:MAG: hypothetical protein HOH19_00140, partial [Kordiimonadaceae bacterium]|nr:hypothetical protein [Kordiimonadaceae bacterium]